MKPLRGMAAVYLREMLILRRRILKQFASWLVSPLLYLVAFHYAMNDTLVGSRPYADFLLPGLVAMSSMTQSWAIASDINISRFYWHTFDEFQTAPLHAAAYVTGEVLAGMTRAVLACLVVMGIGLLGGIQIAYGAPGLWLALLLNAWFFSSLAVALALHVKAPCGSGAAVQLRHYTHGLSRRHVLSIGSPPRLGSTCFGTPPSSPCGASHASRRYRTTRAFSFLRPAFSWCRRRVYVGYLQCQERTGMNLSGGRCFCLMLGVSLLAHGGLFLNRSPLARLSESKEAPLSLRLAVTPAPPAPTNAAESSPQPPRLLRKKKRLPDQRPSRNLRRLKSVPPTRPKLKNGEQPPKKQQHRQSIPAHHRLNRQRPPHLPLHNTPYSRHKEKRKQPPLGTRHSTPWTGRNSSSRQHRVTHVWRNAKVSRDRCSWN